MSEEGGVPLLPPKRPQTALAIFENSALRTLHCKSEPFSLTPPPMWTNSLMRRSLHKMHWFQIAHLSTCHDKTLLNFSLSFPLLLAEIFTLLLHVTDLIPDVLSCGGVLLLWSALSCGVFEISCWVLIYLPHFPQNENTHPVTNQHKPSSLN